MNALFVDSFDQHRTVGDVVGMCTFKTLHPRKPHVDESSLDLDFFTLLKFGSSSSWRSIKPTLTRCDRPYLTVRVRDMHPWCPLDISCTRKQHREIDPRIGTLPSHGCKIRHPSTRCVHREPFLQR